MDTGQEKRLFFDPTPDRQFPELPVKPTDDEIYAFLNSPECPLNKIVVSERNEGAMRHLKRYAFNALCDPYHSCKGMNFGIYSEPGQGKTTVLRRFAETIDIPFLFIQSDNLKDSWQFFEMLSKTFLDYGTPLEAQDDDYHYAVPPCIVAFDEAHSLPVELRTASFLPAMESNDGWLSTRPPSKNASEYLIDCEHICWIAATTDPGILQKQSMAFFDRLRNRVTWNSAGPDEIKKIVRFDSERKNSEDPTKDVLPEEACALVAYYELNPRKAIAFADLMRMEKRMSDCSWAEAAARVAADCGIDQFGMPLVVVKLLTALAKRPISDKNIINSIGCRREQFEAEYKPVLTREVDDVGPLAVPTRSGWAITKYGIAELKRREIAIPPGSQTAETLR